MTNPPSLFRKEALDRASSPDRLDQLMPVTSSLGWLTLATIGALLLLAAAWSYWGEIPSKVTGRGVILRNVNYGIMDVTAESSGDMAAVLKREGDIIQKGEIVARVAQPELSMELESLKSSYALALQHDSEQRKSETDRLAQLQEELTGRQKLQAGGALTRSEVLETKAQIFNLITQSHARTQRLQEQVEKIRQLESRLRHDSVVISNQAGRVTEVLVDVGNHVSPGTRILALESLEGDIEVLGFIPAEDGKKIVPGMAVHVAPSTVKPEEFGYIVGKVTRISTVPVSMDQLRRRLRNEKLAANLAGDGVPIETDIRLEADPQSASGFRWTSPGGPPFKIESGTICSLSVVTERRRPITLVLPYLKKHLGFY